MSSEPREPTRRLFYALWPSSILQSSLGRLARDLQRVAGGRAMRAETLHVTLAFVGDIAASRVAAVASAADRVPFEPFELCLDEIGWFPAKKLGWAGAQVVPAPLARLASNLRAALVADAIPFDPKPFVVHVTLVRNAERVPPAPTFDPIRWPVANFALVESVPVGGYREYRVIARQPRR